MTSASRLGIAASVGLLVSFFLPWFPAVPISISGYNLSQLGGYFNWAWLIPTVGTVCIVANMTKGLLPSARHVLALIGAVIVFGVMLFILTNTLHPMGTAIGLGVYVLSISAISLFVSGCIEPMAGTDRSVLAIIVSYVAMFFLFMAIFSGCYFALGIERVLQPDSYEVSTVWVILTLVIAFLVTMFAGYLCAAINKNWRACQVFALIVFLLALWQCFSGMRRNPDAPNVRAGDVTYLEAISLAVSPMWLHFVNPVVNGAGILLGARLKRRGNT